MFRYLTITIYCLMVILCCSSGTDVAVTQTGNPTKISLIFKAETTQNVMKKAKAATFISSLKILNAYIVIQKVEMEPYDDDDDRVLFKGSQPYIIDLLSDTGSIFIDSAFADSGNRYKEFTIHVAPVDESVSSVKYPDSLLKANSIVIRGYSNNDSLQPFVFTSSIEDKFYYESDSVITITGIKMTNILVSFKIYQWFINTQGDYLDPADTDNNKTIENNIFGSVSVHEQEDTDEDDESND